jgi:hypothetical protein
MHVDALGIVALLVPFVHDLSILAKLIPIFFCPKADLPMATQLEAGVEYGAFRMYVKKSARPVFPKPSKSKSRRNRR